MDGRARLALLFRFGHETRTDTAVKRICCWVSVGFTRSFGGMEQAWKYLEDPSRRKESVIVAKSDVSDS